MRINKIDIYGFGKWTNQTFDLREKDFIVFIGENETGKSTLRAFILFILFGLSPQRREYYLPKKGGQMGGKLELTFGEDTHYTVERFHDRHNGKAQCYDKDGNRLTSDWLESIIGMNQLLYDKIFNFAAQDLQHIHNLEEKQLGDVLLSIGMTGSDRIYLAEKSLKQRLEQQFKTQGKKPVINQLLNTINEKKKQLQQLENEKLLYEKEIEQRYRLEEQLNSLEDKIDDLTLTLNHLNQQLNVYPTIEAYALIEEKRRQFNDEIQFPYQGLKRYEELKQKLYPLQTQLDLHNTKLMELTRECQHLTEQLLDDQAIVTFKHFLTESETYYRNINKKQLQQETLDELNVQINQQLNQLQLPLSKEQLVHLPLSFATEDIWQSLSDEKTLLIEQTEQFKQQLAELIQAEKGMQSLIESIEHKQGENKREKGKLTQPNKRYENMLKKERKKRKVSLFLFVSLLLGSGGLGLALDQPLYYIGGIGLLFVMFFVSMQQRQSMNMLEELLETRDQVAHANDYVREEEPLRSEQLNLKKNRIEQLKITERLEFTEQKVMTLEKKIKEQVNQYEFLAYVPISHWPKLYQQLISILGKIDKYEQLSEKQTKVSNQLTEFKKDFEEHISRYIHLPDEAIDDHFTLVRTALTEQQNRLKQLDSLNVQIADEEGKIKRIKVEMRPHEEAINHLWEKAGVKDEESFLVKGDQYEQHRQLIEERQNAQQKLSVYLTKTAYNKVMNGEALSDRELEREISDKQAQLHQLKADRSDLQQKLANIHATLTNAAQSTKLLDVKHDYYQLQNALEQKATDWAIHQLAYQKIKQTKQAFQIEFLPRVLEHASYYFKTLTNKKYYRIFFRENDEQLQVESSDHLYYSLKELSQGTKDQVYVAVRIAISKQMSKQFKLPFLIDDAFVHFDYRRSLQVMNLFLELTNQHQVIYFSKGDQLLEGVINHNNHKLIKL